MSVVIITPRVKAKIEAMVAEARQRCIPWSVLAPIAVMPGKRELSLADRKAGPARPQAQMMMIGNCEVAFSFEEQPAGICRHMSVAVGKRGKLPHPAAVEMIALEFGFTKFPPPEGRVWVEEYEPGFKAINVVEVAEPAAAGTLQ